VRVYSQQLVGDQPGTDIGEREIQIADHIARRIVPKECFSKLLSLRDKLWTAARIWPK
jgi:hypothetical protein